MGIKNIAVTGSFCAGKSSVCRMLGEKGFCVYETDAFAHGVLENEDVRRRVLEIFGPDVFAGEKIDRKKLAVKAFAEKRSWKALNRIVHPPVIEKVRAELESPGSGKGKVFEVPLLFEAGMEKMFDLVLYVEAPDSIRACRAKGRGFSETDIRERSRFLIDESKKKRLSDFIIVNSGSQEDLNKQLEQVLQHIKQKE
jgi:dephospho-CoA kinase